LHDLAFVAALFTPLFVGLVFHGLCIRYGWLRMLAVSIDRGARFRGRPVFGPNKTWRGVVAVALGAAGGYCLQAAWPQLQAPGLRTFSIPGLAALGFAVGAAAMVGELGNSFLKRQLDIAPGEPGTGPGTIFFYLLDQVDFLAGAWLVLCSWAPPTLLRVFWSILFVVVVHQLVSLLGARLGMRASAR